MVTKEQVSHLVAKKNINNGHFVQFLSYFFGYYENLDARVDLFNILNDDNNLIDLTKKIGLNCRFSLPNYIKDNCFALSNNICLQEFIIYVYGYRAKGIGMGEYLFPFIFKNWKYSSDGDAMVSDGINIHKGEVKNSLGASLKPTLASDAPDRGTIDKLNKSIFDGNIPYKKNWSKFCEKVSSSDLKDKFSDYFTNLFPVWSEQVVGDLTTFLTQNHSDIHKCEDYYSRTVANQYKIYENQSFLIMMDDSLDVVILSDFTDPNLSSLGVKFTAKMKRGRDTQAVPDGYVNIQLVKVKKPKKSKASKS